MALQAKGDTNRKEEEGRSATVLVARSSIEGPVRGVAPRDAVDAQGEPGAKTSASDAMGLAGRNDVVELKELGPSFRAAPFDSRAMRRVTLLCCRDPRGYFRRGSRQKQSVEFRFGITQDATGSAPQATPFLKGAPAPPPEAISRRICSPGATPRRAAGVSDRG